MDETNEALRLRVLRTERALNIVLQALADNAKGLPYDVLVAAEEAALFHRQGKMTGDEYLALRYQRREL